MASPLDQGSQIWNRYPHIKLLQCFQIRAKPVEDAGGCAHQGSAADMFPVSLTTSCYSINCVVCPCWTVGWSLFTGSMRRSFIEHRRMFSPILKPFVRYAC